MSSKFEMPSDSAATDRTLLRRFRTGQDDAATELYLRYAKKLETLARSEMANRLTARFDPEDVVQSVFRTFFRRASEPMFDGPSGDQIWQLLLVIATNKVRKLGRFHRQQKRDVGRTVTATEDMPPPETVDHVPLLVLQMVIDESMADLPEYQRTMIEMRINGHTADEIAEATGRCSRTVERVVKRFREQIDKYIEGNHVDHT